MLLLLLTTSTPAPVVGGSMSVVGSDAAIYKVVGSDAGG